MTQNTLLPPEDFARQGGQPAAELPVEDRLLAGSNATLTHPFNPADPADTNDAVKISTEKRPARARKIQASIMVPQPVEQVWQIITDYERLADFIPNLTSSKLLPHPEGHIRLEQIGAQCFLKFKFCARVVLDMTEHFPSKVGFVMQEGDFKQFSGAWQLQPTKDRRGTRLSYELLVTPPRAMPVALIEHHICHNLTRNLLAIRQQAASLAIQPQV